MKRLAVLVLAAAAAAGCGGTPGVRPTGEGGNLGGAGGAGGSGGDPPPLNVGVAVDTTARHQTLAGFGAAVAFYSNWLSARNDDIYTKLFVDLGLDILRLANWYQNSSALGTSTSTSTPFSDAAGVAIVQKATAAAGHPPKILLSSWSPPAYLKSNMATKSMTAGTLLKQGSAYEYDAFAQWWVSALTAYAANGVVPDYISVQNEPDYFNMGWETCRFDATEATYASYSAAFEAVYAAVQASALASKPLMIGPENSGIGNSSVQRYLAALNLDHVDAVAHHLYNGGSGGNDPLPDGFGAAMSAVGNAVTATGKPIFMTEFAPTTPTLLNTAWVIHDALTIEGVAAYIYWDLIWAPPSSGAAPAGLVTIQTANPSSAYVLNDTYYALKHFARWTDPGWTRVGATSTVGELKASAFVSPDGANLTVVLINTGTGDHVVTLDPGGFAFGTTATYRTSGTGERTTQLPAGDGTLTLPASAIATVTFGP